MEWKKAPEELVEFLAEKMRHINCDFRKMFGYPAYFINGNMFAGIHGEKLFLRFSEDEVKKIRKTYSEVMLFEPMPGRPMKGYIIVPESIYKNEALFNKLIDESREFVSKLPPKTKKKGAK